MQCDDDPALGLALVRRESPTSGNAGDFVAKDGDGAEAQLQPGAQGAIRIECTLRHWTHHVAGFAGRRAATWLNDWHQPCHRRAPRRELPPATPAAPEPPGRWADVVETQ